MSNQKIVTPQSESIKKYRPHWRSRIYAIIGLSVAAMLVVAFATTIGSV
ncbi:MAG: hypothetical protein GX631_02720, partial [Dehalococcoidales bacterium]|nr:hypothetical protein [Dehalococcoidales bacterium]